MKFLNKIQNGATNLVDKVFGIPTSVTKKELFEEILKDCTLVDMNFVPGTTKNVVKESNSNIWYLTTNDGGKYRIMDGGYDHKENKVYIGIAEWNMRIMLTPIPMKRNHKYINGKKSYVIETKK